MLARQPSRLTVKKDKKSLWGGFTASIVCVTKHKPTFKNVTFHFMNRFRESSTGKFIKKLKAGNFLWHNDDVMERLGSDSRNRDSALNLIMESTISRPNLQNIHLIVRKQETRPRKNDWVTRPDHSVWGRITTSRLWIPTWRTRISELKTKKIPMIQF